MTRYYKYGWPTSGWRAHLLWWIDSALVCDTWAKGRHRLICTCELARIVMDRLRPPLKTRGIDI